MKFTQARLEDVIKLTRKYTTISSREHALHPFCAEATWCVVDIPLRDAPAFPDVINCCPRYALMSPQKRDRRSRYESKTPDLNGKELAAWRGLNIATLHLATTI